ncbi:hemerythrin domain-containing protein [Brevundimonas sp. Root1423]|uniref:hemerythrin domain-containing protein n=1 Tax=Brevundimonas sp. Root1423 TaxID=1736462 RepID=UPI0006FE72DF|nr:hemerythrin domain-containing protein [Brevundimonas sp. Root1423]KQY96350.1 hypothetical protein ASD25_00170 [Brevundimonas sp. Root1423]
MDIRALRCEHPVIIDRFSVLGGLCGRIRTRDDAHEARRLVADVDLLLVPHLTSEDAELYPLLMNASDERLRTLGAEASDSVGKLLEIWVRFRDHWTATAILADPPRFASATAGILAVLSVRVAMEEDSLYPAAEAEARFGGRVHDAA